MGVDEHRSQVGQQIIMSGGRVNIIDATLVEAGQSGPGKGVDGKPTKDVEAGWQCEAGQPGPLKIYLRLFCAYRC